MAAFPRGVAQEISDHYNLTQTINDLSKHGGHGELMYRLVDGYTLYGLQVQGDSGRHIIDRIIAQYGRDYEPDEAHAEAATRAFEQHVLSKMFASRRGSQVIGWTTLQMKESARGSRYGVVEGSFASNYPRRKVAVQLSCFERNLVGEDANNDLQLDFLLHWDETKGTGSGTIECIGQHTIRWNLALRAPIPGAIPADLAKVQEYVNPAFISPLLLLALIDFIESWEESYAQPMPEQERQEATYLVGRLEDRATTLLFNQGLHASWKGNLKRAGTGLVEEVFTSWMEQNFPDYVTFFNHTKCQELIKQYQDVMGKLSKKEARGHTAIKKEQKHEIAALFGVANVTTFENYVDTVYKPLLKISSKDRHQMELHCTLHPLEEYLMKRLKEESESHYIGGVEHQALPAKVLADQARRLGYRDEETTLAIQLLLSRHLVGISKGNPNLVYIPIETLSIETIQIKLSNEKSRLLALPQGLIPMQHIETLQKQIDMLSKRLEQDTSEEDLDEVNRQIDNLREQIIVTVSNQYNVFSQDIRDLRGKVDDNLLALKRIKPQIEPAFQGQVQFVQHLSTLRMELIRQQESLYLALESQRTVLTEALERKSGDSVEKVVELQETHRKIQDKMTPLEQRCEILRAQSEGLVHWREVLKQADMLFASPGLPDDLRGTLTKDVVPSITEHLVKHRFDGLKDWEHYKKKVEEINQQFRDRQTTGNTRFVTIKDEYITILRDMHIGQSALRARYEYGADDASYRDLHDEVVEKIRKRLDEMGRDIEQNNSDLIRVEYLQSLSDEQTTFFHQSKQTHQQNCQTFQALRDTLGLDIVKDLQDALPTFRDQVNELREQIIETRRMIGKLLTVNQSRDENEEIVFSLLEGRQDSDLTQLFLSLRKEHQDISLETLLDRLRSLFSKGQIEIRVRRRAGG
jgi:hypothetical protein